jgi:flagellar biosynthesis protein FlhF
MRLKRFQAPTMADAMRQVRAALGADALILSTRRAGSLVEVTAALEPEADEPPPPAPDAAPDPALAAALAFHGVPAALHAALALAGAAPDALAAALAARIAFAPLPLAPGGAPLLFAGPPGAGKTLTVARLATRLVLAGTQPLVITADGKRAGATEQIAAFTRLLGLTLLVANHPVALGRALARREGAAPVLIDAPGGDAAETEALAGVAAAVPVAVLPAGLDPGEAADIAQAHAAAGARFLVATRLDAARRLGGVFAAAAADPERLALAECGVGPGAADGLVPATPSLLAARLLAPVTPSQAGAAV